MSKLSLNGQSRLIKAMQSDSLSVSECHKLVEKLYAEENQVEMFTETKLSKRELDARQKFNTAFDRACKAFQEIDSLEANYPGITAQSISDKLDITVEKVNLLYKLVGKFRSSLEYRRVSSLVGV